MMIRGMYILNKERNSMNIIFKLSMFVSSGLLIYNAAGHIAGIWGVILSILFYAVVKTIVINIYEKRQEIKETATEDVS